MAAPKVCACLANRAVVKKSQLQDSSYFARCIYNSSNTIRFDPKTGAQSCTVTINKLYVRIYRWLYVCFDREPLPKQLCQGEAAAAKKQQASLGGLPLRGNFERHWGAARLACLDVFQF